MSDFYFGIVINLIPRMLSLLDRDRNSPTHGCLDRPYWHYKVASDFPSAIYQQGALVLALIFKKDFPGNIYYQNVQIAEYAKASMVFWKNIQNKDGSFNEWFPCERSHVATAFTAYAVSEAYLTLGEAMAEWREREEISFALIKAGRWLGKNYDRAVANHTAGAVAALHNIYLISGDDYFRKSCQKNIDILLENQSNEGWFREYGGADIGYLSVTVDFLAKYYQKSKDEKIRGSLGKALDFMKYFLHPDGSSGGEYGSRNTKYLLPHGLEILSGEFESAKCILSCFKRNFDTAKYINPLSSDDRYFIFFFFGNYLQAGFEELKSASHSDFCPQEEFLKIFQEAGLVSKKNKRYHAVLNYKKGVVKVFAINSDGSRVVFNNTGYSARTDKNVLLSSQWLNLLAKTELTQGTDGNMTIKSKTPFHYVKSSLPLAKFMIPFRVFNYTAAKFASLSKLFNRWIKKSIIINKKTAPLFLERILMLEEDKIIIEDRISASKEMVLKNLYSLNDISYLYSPTSKYFSYPDFTAQPAVNFDLSKYFNNTKEVYLKTEIEFSEKGPFTKYWINGKQPDRGIAI